PLGVDHLEKTLLRPEERTAPLVTVLDGASHALAFLGSIFGQRTVPLGMDRFGQSGDRANLYDYAGIDAGHIVNAALLPLDARLPISPESPPAPGSVSGPSPPANMKGPADGRLYRLELRPSPEADPREALARDALLGDFDFNLLRQKLARLDSSRAWTLATL